MIGRCRVCDAPGEIHHKFKRCAECVTDFQSRKGEHMGDAPIPALPTRFPPGSAAKERVLVERFAAKEQLFHPFDARWFGDGQTEEFLAASGEKQESLLRSKARNSRLSELLGKILPVS